MAKRFFHESGILKWLEEEFPVFNSPEGQEELEKRAGEIIEVLEGYFTPDYVRISDNAKYLKPDLDTITAAYQKRDYKEMGRALEMFKFAVEYM